MKLSVIIPNYNGAALLKKNIPRLLHVLAQEKKHSFEVIMVDDASSDDSVDCFKALMQKKIGTQVNTILVQNPQNCGFSHSVNRGIHHATGEYIVFLNTDVVPKEGFLAPALQHFEDEHVFGVGFMDESIEGERVVYRGRGIGQWKRGFYIHERGEVDQKDTDWLSGGSSIVRRTAVQKLGGFNEIYDPFYWEDIDLSYRAKKAGYKLVFEPLSVVLHEHAKGAILSKYTARDIVVISYRNQFLFVWNNAAVGQLIMHIAWLPYHIVKAAARHDSLFIAGLWQALKRKAVFRT